MRIICGRWCNTFGNPRYSCHLSRDLVSVQDSWWSLHTWVYITAWFLSSLVWQSPHTWLMYYMVSLQLGLTVTSYLADVLHGFSPAWFDSHLIPGWCTTWFLSSLVWQSPHTWLMYYMVSLQLGLTVTSNLADVLHGFSPAWFDSHLKPGWCTTWFLSNWNLLILDTILPMKTGRFKIKKSLNKSNQNSDHQKWTWVKLVID